MNSIARLLIWFWVIWFCLFSLGIEAKKRTSGHCSHLVSEKNNERCLNSKKPQYASTKWNHSYTSNWNRLWCSQHWNPMTAVNTAHDFPHNTQHCSLLYIPTIDPKSPENVFTPNEAHCVHIDPNWDEKFLISVWIYAAVSFPLWIWEILHVWIFYYLFIFIFFQLVHFALLKGYFKSNREW